MVRLTAIASAWVLVLGAGASNAVAPASGDVIVLSGGSLVRVDSAIGDRTILSGGNPFADLALDPDGELVATTTGERGVVAIDPASGEQRTISSWWIGAGPGFVGPAAIDVTPVGDLVVLDSTDCSPHGVLTPWKLLRVDPDTGDRSVVSGPERGSGPDPNDCTGLAVGPDGVVYVANERTVFPRAQILAIEPETGDRSVLSSGAGSPEAAGAGPDFATILAITADAGGVWVLDRRLEEIWEGQSLLYLLDLYRVLHVDPATGDRTVVSDTDQEEDAIPQRRTVDLARPEPGTLLLLDDQGVVVVDEGSGERTTIEAPFYGPRALAAGGGEVYVAWAGFRSIPGGITRVAIPSGAPTPVTDDRVGGGPPFGGAPLEAPALRRLALGPRGNLLVTVNEAVFRVHPKTGHRTILSDATTGEGPSLGEQPTGLAVGSEGAIYASTWRPNTVLRIDASNGNRTLVSGEGMGTGPEIPEPDGCRELEAEPEGTLLCVGSRQAALEQVVLRIDPATGDRTELLAVPFFGASSIRDLLALGSDEAYFSDPVGRAWHRLDLSTGIASLLSAAGTGTGPTPSGPAGLALRPNGAILAGDASRLLRIDPATGNRVLVSGSHPTQPVVVGEGVPFGTVLDVVFAPEPSGLLLQIVAAGLLWARARRA